MKFESKVRVRVCETDALGHVSNVSYFIYLEEARVQFFKEFNKETDMKKWNFILASTTCDFVQQAYFDQVLHIETVVERIGTSSFHLNHYIMDGDRQLIARGKASVVHFNFETQKSAPLLEDYRKALELYTENTSDTNEERRETHGV